MDYEHLRSSAESRAPLHFKILQNGKYHIGGGAIDPNALLSAIRALLDSDELRIFVSDHDLLQAVDRLRMTPPNEEEWNLYETFEGKRLSTQERNAKSKEFLDALHGRDFEFHNDRLKQMFERRFISAYLKNFEAAMSDSLLRALSIVQIRVENDLRNELGMKELSANEMRHFVYEPIKKSERIQLGIETGRKQAPKGSSWSALQKIEFARAVDGIPKTKRGSIWFYIFEELWIGDFTRETVKHLKRNPVVESVPPELIDEVAVKWRKYDEFSEIKDEESKPRMMDFRFAMMKIGIDKELTFGTLKVYLTQGRKLLAEKLVK